MTCIRQQLICFLMAWTLAVALPSAAESSYSSSLFGTKERMSKLGDEQYDLNFQGASLAEALSFLADVAGMNAMIPIDTKGTLNLRLSAIDLETALNVISDLHGLDFEAEDGFLRFGPKEKFAEERKKLVTESIRLKFALAKDLMEALAEFVDSESGALLADERTNTLIVRDTVAVVEQMKKVIAELDTTDIQILIESRIAEVTRDWGKSLGIEWGGAAQTSGVDIGGLSAVGVSGVVREDDTSSNLFAALPSGVAPNSGIGIAFGLLGGRLDLDVALAAAETNGLVDILSEPTIVTSNGTPADITSVETFSIKTAPGLSSAGSIATVTAGLELKVTPTYSSGDKIKLEISALSSSPDFSRSVDGIPSITANEAKTTVLVRDGESTVIGGFSKVQGQDVRAQVPGLGRLPLLGYLFRSKRRSKTNSEVMIFIKPSILEETSEIALNKKEYRLDQIKSGRIIRKNERDIGDPSPAKAYQGLKSKVQEKTRKFRSRFAR